MDASSSSVFLLSVALAAALWWPLFLDALRGQLRWEDSRVVFIGYLTAQFLLWPAMMALTDTTVIFATVQLRYRNELSEQYLHALSWLIVAAIFFHAGYALPSRIRRSSAPDTDFLAAATRRRIIAISTIGGLATIGAGYGYFSSMGGLDTYIDSIDRFRSTEGSGKGIYLFPMSATLLVTALGIVWSWQRKQRVSSIVVIAFLASSIVVALAGIRVILVGPLLALLVGYSLFKRRVRFATLFAVLSAFVLLNSGYSLVRTHGFTDDAIRDVGFSELAQSQLRRFHGPESLARGVDYVERGGASYVPPFLVFLATSFVPRIIWDEKPLSAGNFTNLALFPDTFTASDTGAAVPTLVGELWLLGGPTCLVVGFFAVGILCRLLWLRVLKGGFSAFCWYSVWLGFALGVNETLSLYLVRGVALGIGVWLFVAIARVKLPVRRQRLQTVLS